MGLPREHWPGIAGTTHRERVSGEVRRRADAIGPLAFRRSIGRIAPDPGDDAIIRRAGARMPGTGDNAPSPGAACALRRSPASPVLPSPGCPPWPLAHRPAPPRAGAPEPPIRTWP
jgi:hypothetical protein